MLINCPECGREISDQAEACIYCGYPIKKMIEADSDNVQENTVHEEVIEQSPIKASEPVKSGITEKSLIKVVLIFAAIIAVIIASVAIKGGSLNSKEQYVYEVVEKYRGYMKDPDSLTIRGDILYVENSDYVKFVIFSATGNNSYGGKVTNMPMFQDKTYIANYGDDYDDFDTIEEKEDLARCNLALLTWNLKGSEMAEDDSYNAAELISGEKIAKKLKCDWKEQ